MRSLHDAGDAVMFIEDVAQRLRTSRTTIDRCLRAGTFPIPEMPRIDNRHRWSRAVVESWLQQPQPVAMPRRRSA